MINNYLNKSQVEYKEMVENTHKTPLKRPEWLRVKAPSGQNYEYLQKMMQRQKLNTVCEEADCPNIAECWGHRTATFMILGDTCTRSCGFCAVKVGRPNHLDLQEPQRVAEAVKELNLRHVVITSVDRDDLKDGGSLIFSETVRLIRQEMPETTIEILIPDFKGDEEAFKIIMQNPPDILNHNLETVPRLYPYVRPQAKYKRSLELLLWFKEHNLRTKSGIMVGIGEQPEEVLALMQDLVDYKCDILTIGQYLQPTKEHLPIDRYVTPEEFRMYKMEGLKMGFKIIESGPLVRSSYHADAQAREIL
ncbi:MAG TPA: lipoyl synthase [Bacteroidetes bacterium]|nr:lipoyl synthase [Bacteroidota bacterium]